MRLQEGRRRRRCERGDHTYTAPVLTELRARAAYLETAGCGEVLSLTRRAAGSGFPARSGPRRSSSQRHPWAGYRTRLGYDDERRDRIPPGAGEVALRRRGRPQPATASPSSGLPK